MIGNDVADHHCQDRTSVSVMSGRGRTQALILFFLFLFALPALAAPAAHPALWHVQGRAGEVYLFGSIHVMPPDAQWHTPAIDRAMARSDVFVFELPTDAATMARMQGLVAAHGYLPPGESLLADQNGSHTIETTRKQWYSEPRTKS